jgi:hypothetical protein
MMPYLLILLCLLGLLGWMVMTQPPRKTASLIVKSGPLALIGLGIFLTALQRGFFGIPMIYLGVRWLRRRRPLQPMSPPGGRTSTVSSEYLEMELDHDTGEMDGTVLSGAKSGSRLSSLGEEEIVDLCREFHADPDTVTMLETYLDRTHQGWRENSDFRSSHTGHDFSDSTTMSKKEACQILGVTENASREEILKAWRQLIKKVHPDSGGSAFLTAKINAAKEVLLG